MNQPRSKPGVRQPLLRCPPLQQSATWLSAFIGHCGLRSSRTFADYAAFERYSIERYAEFWSLFLEWSGLLHEGSAAPVVEGSDCESAQFFPNLRLNYAANLLRVDHGNCAAERPALTAVHYDGRVERWSRGELRQRVEALSGALAGLGLTAGARIAIVAPNTPEAVLACLGAAALGCTVSTCAPELGTAALLARLDQVEPELLLVQRSIRPAASRSDDRERLEALIGGLPSLRGVVVLDEGEPPQRPLPPVHRLSALLSEPGTPAPWPQLPFNHPLFILFTSGTTGSPKCLVHGAGGTLIEHLKEHRLHCDLNGSDRLFFHTSTGWMMWNWQLSALACGTELVLYDGPVSGADRLWSIVAAQRVSVFGTSPAYLQLCERSGWAPEAGADFDGLRAVLSTGSILRLQQQDWVCQHIKPLAVQSISGGTDIIGCFVLGNPLVDAYSAECQSRSLGLDVRALRGPDSPEAPGVGELVCANPFPSRPLGLLHDPDGARFHAAYFAANPGWWTHGDLIEFTPEGSVRMHGRSDGVLKVHGIRIGPAEIYAVLADFPEIVEAMAVEQSDAEQPGGTRLILLLVLRPGVVADEALCSRIRRELASRASPAHVPETILTVDELPTTHSGKHSERSARDALNGVVAGNALALRNPACLEPLRSFARRHSAAPQRRDCSGQTLQQTLTQIWQEVLQLATIGPHENYFELGGDSLKALRIFAELERRTGRRAPLPLLFEAPTLARLSAAVAAAQPPAYQPLVTLAPGAAAGPPLFIVHGIGGSAMELRTLARQMGLPQAVYALQARGFHPGDAPRGRIEEMAREYLNAIRALQPEGPYLLVGYSFGGMVAHEMARLLDQAGQRIGLLAILDTTLPEPLWPRAAWGEYLRRRLRCGLREMSRLPPRRWLWFCLGLWRALRERLRRRRHAGGLLADEARQVERLPEYVRRIIDAGVDAAQAYRPQPGAVPVALFRSDLSVSPLCDPAIIWRGLAPALRVYEVPGDHQSMIRPPYVEALAGALARCVRDACSGLAQAAAGGRLPDARHQPVEVPQRLLRRRRRRGVG